MTSMFAPRLVYPEPSPAVCVTFFSCCESGTRDLQQTYAAAVRYLEAQEERTAGGAEPAAAATTRRLPYELIWVDNGGSAEAHTAFLDRGAQFEVVRRNPTN